MKVCVAQALFAAVTFLLLSTTAQSSTNLSISSYASRSSSRSAQSVSIRPSLLQSTNSGGQASGVLVSSGLSSFDHSTALTTTSLDSSSSSKNTAAISTSTRGAVVEISITTVQVTPIDTSTSTVVSTTTSDELVGAQSTSEPATALIAGEDNPAQPATSAVPTSSSTDILPGPGSTIVITPFDTITSTPTTMSISTASIPSSGFLTTSQSIVIVDANGNAIPPGQTSVNDARTSTRVILVTAYPVAIAATTTSVVARLNTSEAAKLGGSYTTALLTVLFHVILTVHLL